MQRVRAEAPLILIAIGGIALTAWTKPDLIRFWPFSVAEAVQIFTPLVLIALFIERALEVLLTPWRGKGSEEIGKQTKSTRERLSHGQASFDDVHSLEQQHTQYKADTQRIAFLAALALGIVVSALGVRGLEPFLDPAAFKELSSNQRTWFTLLDVLLTGALLGGGAEGIHKVVSVFTNFMDTAAKKAKGEA